MKTRTHILARVKAEKQGWLAIASEFDADYHQTYSAYPIVNWVLTFECPEEITPTSDIHKFRADTSVPFGPNSPRTRWLPEDDFGCFVERPLAYLPPEDIRIGKFGSDPGRLRTNEERLASYVTAYEEHLTSRIASRQQDKGHQK